MTPLTVRPLGRVRNRWQVIARLGAALLGLFLFASSVYGDLSTLPRHSKAKTGAVHKNGLVFQGTNAEKLATLFNSVPSDELPHRLTRSIAANVVHYWPKEGETDRETEYTFFENWTLYSLTKLEKLSHNVFGIPHRLRFARLERWELERILEKGVGWCGQVAIALVEFLQDQGVDARVTALDGHVVASATWNNTEFTLDPDYNVVLPHSVPHLEVNPILVRNGYANAGYNEKIVQDLVRIYGTEGNYVGGYATLPRAIVKSAEVVKYALPLALVVLALLSWNWRLATRPSG